MSATADSFIKAASIPMDGSSHTDGSLDEAKAILAGSPRIATESIYTAAVLGNDSAVRQFLQVDPQAATVKGGPYGWDALTYLCFSRFLRLDKQRSSGFVSAATMLLDAGANPNTGFYSAGHLPDPIFESALYGAAGVAHHSGLTKLLLERGADPNDGETEYHSPEWFDNRPMEIIVESGKLAPMGLTTMLIRKLDWTNYQGVVWLLEHGADPNMMASWGDRALGHSLARDNALKFIELLLDHGADPLLESAHGVNAFVMAAGMGRGDVLDLFERRGFAFEMEGSAAFLAACARGDLAAARAVAEGDPEIVPQLKRDHPQVLASFAGAGNTAGVEALLDFGFDIESRTGRGANGDTALHLAIWRERFDTVKFLLQRGASIDAVNARGENAVAIARRALVEMSEWTPHESTYIVDALLDHERLRLDSGGDRESYSP